MVKNLKDLRNQNGMSQQQLAAALGISQQSINKYENHNIEPDISTLSAMADIFNTTIDYLVGRTTLDKPIGCYTNYTLTEKEKRLIDAFRKLENKEKAFMLMLIDSYNNLDTKK